MGRVIFFNPFPRDQLTGGIKTTWQHAAMLCEIGAEALLYTPDGPADWIDDPSLRQLAHCEVSLAHEDVLVFPEVIMGSIEETLQRRMPCRKVMFCQGVYIFLGFYKSFKTLKEWGVEAVAVPGHESRRVLNSVYGEETMPVSVIPPFIDRTIFYCPPDKARIVKENPSILVFGRKWHYGTWEYDKLIQKMLRMKYPELATIPWVTLDYMNIAETGKAMRNAAVCLSLAKLEGLGITALEAMACGCAVVGFHGGGGLDYAREDNGFWHSPEELEDLVDSLALALRGMVSGEGFVWEKACEGQKTAGLYRENRTKEALMAFYRPFIGPYDVSAIREKQESIA